MSPTDVAGLGGVGVVLIAYAGAALGRMDPERPLSLCCNLFGSVAILWSLLTQDFNLSATAMEGAWVVVSFLGLVRWAIRRRRAEA
ncbi:MAG: hypothetical protein DI570_25045 [Phenylobacterium zucineum]|nr:MAG: hypothetical protein DI570_25045 [Phenylobacterium zucineum]